MKRDFSTILLDFDYTLADSSTGIIECVNYGLQGVGLPPSSDDSIRQTIGLRLPAILAALAGEEHGAKADAFSRLFIERAEEIMADSTVLLAGTRPTLGWLKAQGYQVGIVTTKFRYRIETVMERERLINLLDVIVGAEDVERHKPDPQSLFLAIDQLNSTPTETLYVGDSVTDADAAHRARLPFIGVLSGVTLTEAFEPFGPCAVLNDVSGLPAWLSG